MSILPFPERRPAALPGRVKAAVRLEGDRVVILVADRLTRTQQADAAARVLRAWMRSHEGRVPALVPAAAVLSARAAVRAHAGLSAAAAASAAAVTGGALVLSLAAAPAHPVRMAESPAHAVVRSSTSPYPSMPRPAPGARGGSGDGGGVPDPAPGTPAPALVTPAPARTSPPGVLPHILPRVPSSLSSLPGLPLPLPTRQVSGVVPEVTHTAHKVERVVCHLNLLGVKVCVKVPV